MREAIFDAIPYNLKKAVSVGIGLFIAFIGLQNAKVVIGGSTLLSLFSLDGYNKNLAAAAGGKDFVAASMNDVGITVLAIIGIIITGIMVVKNVKGNILWGILITWVLGIICQFAGLYVPNPELGFYSLLPDFSAGISIPSLSPIFAKFSLEGVPILEFVVIVFAFLFVDLFDTLGTLIGVSSKANMLDKDGKLPRIKGALLADAVGTTAGAVLGTSTTTTFVESSSGVAEGGRTGLTAVTTAVLFGLSLFLSPIFLAIPSFATAPALVIVGFYMLSAVTDINFADAAEGIPAFICIAAMPFFYRRNLYGSSLLCIPESADRKSEKDQSGYVCTGSLVCIEISVDLVSERILNVRITLLKGCPDILFSDHIICLMVLADFRYQMLPEHIRQQRI